MLLQLCVPNFCPVYVIPADDVDHKKPSPYSMTHLGHQLLESRALHETGPGASEVIIDNADLGKAELAGVIDQPILAPLALLVVDYLTRAGLANIPQASSRERVCGSRGHSSVQP